MLCHDLRMIFYRFVSKVRIETSNSQIPHSQVQYLKLLGLEYIQWQNNGLKSSLLIWRIERLSPVLFNGDQSRVQNSAQICSASLVVEAAAILRFCNDLSWCGKLWVRHDLSGYGGLWVVDDLSRYDRSTWDTRKQIQGVDRWKTAQNLHVSPRNCKKGANVLISSFGCVERSYSSDWK